MRLAILVTFCGALIELLLYFVKLLNIVYESIFNHYIHVDWMSLAIFVQDDVLLSFSILIWILAPFDSFHVFLVQEFHKVLLDSGYWFQNLMSIIQVIMICNQRFTFIELCHDL